MRTESQKAQILAALQRGEMLTEDDAYALCGSRRLAARIDELQKDGHVIDRKPVKTYGGAHVALYWLRRKSEVTA